MTKFAWAIPIRPEGLNGLKNPFVFLNEFPEPPESNSIFTFMDEEGAVVSRPTETERNLPPYCYVQYVEEFPPPPPPGYLYAWSELQRDVCSTLYHLYHEVGTLRYGVDTPNLSGYALFELSKPERSGLVSTLVEHADGYFSTEAGVLVSNFTIRMHRLLRVFGMNGSVCEKLEYSVESGNCCYLSHAIYDVENLDKLPEYIRAKVSGCMVNINVPRVDAQIVFHLRSSLLRLPRADKYTSSGWCKVNGTWFYAQDDIELPEAGIVFETGFKIASNHALSDRDAMYSAMGMLSLSNDATVIVPLILYAHLGVLFTLFEQAGFAPRLLLFINGKTGSLKTAVCSVLYNLSGEMKRNIPATFRDSVASVEAKFPDYVDKVLLLDDYSPATTARNRADMNKLLEDVIRYFGDGKGRGRSNATVTEAKTPIPRGLCCITGEDTGGSQSSLLRCLLIDVSNGVFNGERLAPYQSDPRLWTTHFHFFVQYVADRFYILMDEIRNLFPVLRNELRQKLSAGRIIDSAVYLRITAKILLEYGVHVGWISNSDLSQLLDSWSSAVIDSLKKSEDASAELDPVRFYISTLFDAVDSGAEIIAPDKDTFLNDTSVLGYDHKGCWHVWPDRLYDLVVKRCRVHRKIYSLSQTKVHAALADACLITVSEEKRGEKKQVNYTLRDSFGERPRMLRINKEAAQRYLEE